MMAAELVANSPCALEQPSIENFILELQNCREKRSLHDARRVHVDICSHGLEGISAVGNYLLSLYVECQSLHHAVQVFSCLANHNEYSWTSLIQGFADCGDAEHAFEVHDMMIEDAWQPTTYTYVALLKACTKMKWVEKGLMLHVDIVQAGFESDPFISNTLVHMYFKFGMLSEARDILDSLPFRDVVLWTALISGYVEVGLCEEALSCVSHMQSEGMSPDPVTYVCCLKACGILGDADRGCEMHANIIKKGFDGNVIVGNTLVDMYTRCGMLVDAKEVFEQLQVKDIVSWNALATGYAEQGLGADVMKLVKQMRMVGVDPDGVTYICCLRGCSSIGAMESGMEVHAELVQEGYDKDIFVSTALVDFYAKFGALTEARETFDEMPMHDLVSWTALITGYADHGYDDDVVDCFWRMQVDGVPPRIATIMSVIFSYAEQGEIEMAHKQFCLMQEQGLLPNNSIFVGVLVACGNSFSPQFGKRTLSQVHQSCLDDIILATAAIDMYGKCGNMVGAHNLLDALSTRVAVTWNALLTGYAQHGNELVFRLLKTMAEESLRPDKVTYLNVVSVCSQLGLVDEALEYLVDMTEKDIEPTLKHYACLVDLLCRVGRLDEAVSVLEKSPIQPSLVSWHAVLSACHKWGSVELGRHAFENAVSLDEDHGAAYILMANIYADANVGEVGKKLEQVT